MGESYQMLVWPFGSNCGHVVPILIIYVNSKPCNCMVGLSMRTYFAGLHSHVNSLRLTSCRGGCICLVSFDWA